MVLMSLTDANRLKLRMKYQYVVKNIQI